MVALLDNAKVGLEIECLANADIDNSEELNNTIDGLGYGSSYDGSIHADTSDSYALEVNTKPYKTTELNTLKTDLKTLYGEVVNHVNSSCGLHIHVSFSDYKRYMALLSLKFCHDFETAFRERFKKDAVRLDGSNSWCKPYKDIQDFNSAVASQLLSGDKGGTRYKLVNYNSYNRFETIEFRCFKACSTANGVYIRTKWLCDFISKWLKTNKTKFLKEQLKTETTPIKISNNRNLNKIDNTTNTKTFDVFNVCEQRTIKSGVKGVEHTLTLLSSDNRNGKGKHKPLKTIRKLVLNSINKRNFNARTTRNGTHNIYNTEKVLKEIDNEQYEVKNEQLKSYARYMELKEKLHLNQTEYTELAKLHTFFLLNGSSVAGV